MSPFGDATLSDILSYSMHFTKLQITNAVAIKRMMLVHSCISGSVAISNKRDIAWHEKRIEKLNSTFIWREVFIYRK